ncbi:hypothetical protein E2C00_31325 [Streptomyces sp. WAC05374]|uniref:2OG-Fe dioxygenase family protein n=1 Tax=Streptomyces sp. WAC05374 TaxID=2487420 RepID=UPI000F866DCE|nr:2OG-Fe dioxygenase family protein [Streptomyces sp. WAC05374]RST18341.1 hypothetical protein EF905_05830 [Streptomyces sp. WAC05374]TDF39112.1 hypothetical protein E2B92_26730 [Streptomyces sp. WAC05374]TDF47465.1 hypothetical protein E2C02_30430 [Streptomyces sp. WAC05374]TDF48220.1 hypothetical protein E2C00_31325 [Streptomyces sp. WAC05374]
MSPSTTAHPPAISTAVDDLSAWGGHLLSAADVSLLTGATAPDWDAYARHWDDLLLDEYMQDGGTYRHRRYGHYVLDAATGDLTAQPHGPYYQPRMVNPLNGGVRRHFAPLTDAFRDDPLTRALVLTLGDVFSRVEGVHRWDVKLHPFRIVTTPDQQGRPAPQGVHRDGTAFVTSLLVGRTNVTGGESSLYAQDGTRLLTTTLVRPGDQLLADDRRLLHDVTPLTPVDPARPAYRDVLIIDFDHVADETGRGL